MIDSEFLSSNELAEISGCKLPSGQRDWLDRNGWKYVLNAAKADRWQILCPLTFSGSVCS